MGDAGALFLGILIASLAIRLDPQLDSTAASFATPILLLAVPILDTSVAVISRISRGLSPFVGGKDHLSHRLMRKGLTKPKAAFSLWGLTGVFSLVALALPQLNASAEKTTVSIVGALWIGLFAFFFNIAHE